MRNCSNVVTTFLSILLLVVAFPASSSSQILKIWNPLNDIGGNKNWDNQFNWIQIGFPSASDTAEFQNSTDSAYISTTESIAVLRLNGGAIGGTGVLSVSDLITWNGGRFVGSGTLAVAANAEVRINSGNAVVEGWNVQLASGVAVSGTTWLVIGDTLNIASGTVSIEKLELTPTAVVTGSGVLEITDSLKWNGATFVGNGTLRITVGSSGHLSSNEGTLNGWTLENIGQFRHDVSLLLMNGIVNNSGTFTMNSEVWDAGGTNVFSNGGTFQTGAGSGTVSVPFNTSVAVVVADGPLTITGGGEASGTLTITEPSTIMFLESGYTFDAPVISGTGWTIVDSAITVTGNTTISKFDFTGYSGSMAGASTVTVTDSMKWGGGSLNGTGELIIGSSAVLVTPPEIDSYLNLSDHTLTNNGTVIQTTEMNVQGGSQIVNHGTYRVMNVGFTFEGVESPAFNNFGIFEFADTLGSTAFQIPFKNSGSVEIQSGWMRLYAGGTNSGTISISHDTALFHIAADTFALSVGTDVKGPGYFALAGGILNVLGTSMIDKFRMMGAAVGGTGELVVRDTLLWYGGTLGGAGQVTIAEGGYMGIEQGSRTPLQVLETRSINNLGTIVQRSNFESRTSGNVLNSGTYDLMGNHAITTVESPGFFYNTGTLNKLAGEPNGGPPNGIISIPVANEGTLYVDGFSTLALSGGLDNLGLAENTLTGGTFILEGSLTVPEAVIDSNDAVVTLSGGLILNDLGASVLSGLMLNKGTLTIGNPFFSTSTLLRNTGTLIIAPGCSLTVLGYTQESGTTYFRSGGSGGIDPGRGMVEIAGGAFYGNGTIFGALENRADLHIGEDIGTLSVSTFLQTETGVLHVDIGGISQGVDHDHLSLPFGLATLDGSLKVRLVNGFVPGIEMQTFPIVSHEGRDSTFDAVIDLDAGDGIRMIAKYPDESITNVVANFAPIFEQSFPDTTINENQTLTLGYSAIDSETESVTFSLISPVAGMSIDTLTGEFSWTPNYDQSGIHELIVGASDPFETTLDTVIVTVQHVNRAPLFTTVFPDTTIAEGQQLQFTITGADPDLDILAYLLEDGPAGSAVNSETGTFSWTPGLSDSGSHTIIFSLTDGLIPILDTAWVEVTNTNVPPVFTPGLRDTTILENSTLQLTLTGSDFDLNALTFGKMQGPEGLNVLETGELSWTTSYEDSGTHAVVLSLFDGIDTTLDTAFVHVQNVNRLPVFSVGLPDTVISEAEELTFAVNAVDADLDGLAFGLSSGPAGVTVSPEGVFTWTPSYTDSGLYTIVISVTDGMGTVTDTALVTVLNTNIPPAFVLHLPDTSINEGEALIFTMTASDFDQNALAFAKVAGPEFFTVSAEGHVEWNTTHDDSGTYRIVVSVADEFAATLDTATVIIQNVNRLPYFLLTLPDTVIEEVQALSFAVSGGDLDADPVSFALVEGPEGAQLSTGGLFSWTPSYSDSGKHRVVLSITDGFGLTRDTAFVRVTNVNRLPFFVTAFPDTVILENTTLTKALAAGDDDDDIPIFAKVSGPSGLTISAEGIVNWTTSYSDSGKHQLVISLSDGLGLVRDTAFITVIDVNRLPVVTLGLPDTTIAENQALNIALSAHDPDGGSLSYAVLKGPAGASVSAGGVLSWTPSYLQAGVDTVVIGITDGIGGVADTAIITVMNVNRLPGLVSLLEPAQGDTVKLAVPLTAIKFTWTKSPDPDTDDTLYYLVRIAGPGLDTTTAVKADTSAVLDLTGRLQPSGEYAWSVGVTDRIDTVAAQGSRMFRTSSTITSVGNEGVIPVVFSLGQNYPNPFNPTTTISYALPARSDVTVEVFNLLGQVIATLVHGEQAPGNHSVVWNGRSSTGRQLSSGIYFYRLHAKSHADGTDFIQTRRLVLLK